MDGMTNQSANWTKNKKIQSYAPTDDSYTETDKICPPVKEWPNILSEPNYHKIGDDREIQPLHDDWLAEEIAKKC